MAAYLPQIPDLVHLIIAWVVALLLVGLGAASRLRPTRNRPELQLVIGWGIWSLLATGWAVLTPFPLLFPAILAALVASAGLICCMKPRDWTFLARLGALTAPLWLVMASVQPAEPDTWLNLLPNADYLVEYGRLPTAATPPSHSFLPAAPYNTQLMAYLGGLLDPDYPAGGMSLDNLALLVAAGGIIARALAGAADRSPSWGTAAPSWGTIAAGVLLATLLNPGFVPRIHLAAYGETGLAVTALAVAVLAAEMPADMQEAGWVSLDETLALGLVLAAMVNIKQSGFGLVAAVVAAAGVVCALAAPRRMASTIKTVAAALLLPVALYLLWRWFVAHAGVDELTPLPLSQWQWANIPAILASMLHTVLNKGLYFGCVLASFLALPFAWRAQGWSVTTRLLTFNAALFVCYTGFLVLTYIGHFPGAWSTEAHSFFRYETHLSLVLTLTLALAARDALLALRPTLARARAPALGAAALVLLAPPALARLLRFDADMPQPLVWMLARHVTPALTPADRLALLLPGDNGSVATMLSGILRDTAPRNPDLAIVSFNHADAATLDRAAAEGYDMALISCTPAGLAGLSEGQAAILRRGPDGWIVREAWSYPADMTKRRWQHVLAWPPLCRQG